MKCGAMVSAAWVTATLAVAMNGAAAERLFEPNYAKVNTDRWRCRLCPFEMASAKEATWTVGAVHVAEPSARFGRDSGLAEAGARADMDLRYRRRDDNGRMTEVVARRLGLDSRTVVVGVEGGRVKARLDRREIPRNISVDGVTPFAGVSTLTLPGDWQGTFDTARMTGLGEATRFNHGTERRRTSARVRVDPRPEWWVQAGYSRETKSGTAETFADFLYQSTGLPKPVALLTEELTTSAGVERAAFTLAAELRNTRFRNRRGALDWQNPWRGPSVLRGRKALAPDNDARSLSLVSRMALGRRVAAHATLTWGEARQDDVFEPYTTNTRLALDALPANRLDGRVRSFAGSFKLLARPTDRLRLIVGHRHRERDNQTATLTLRPVRGDAFMAGAVTSRPFDVERSTTALGVTYRVAPRVGLGFYADSNRIRRAPAEVAANEERRHRIELGVNGWRGIRAKFAFAEAERRASEFRSTTSNNPLTRRYHHAARDQRTWLARVGYELDGIGAFVELVAECRSNAYPESALGLQRDGNCTRGVDVAYAPLPNVSIAAFYLEQEINAATAGQVGFRGSDWRYSTVDAVDTAGISLDVGELFDGVVELSVDYVRSLGAGAYATELAGESLPFPDLVSNHTSVDVHARYQWRERSALVFRLRHERFRGEDWALVDALDAIRNVVTFGSGSPRYANRSISASYEASF